MSALKRDSDAHIPVQIHAILKKRILDGTYPAGQRLPAVRTFLKEFSISPITLVKAFDLLEEEGFIKRTPRHGVFAIDPVTEGGQPYRIAFCFPPQKFDSEVIGMEEWGLASEFYRGLLAGASQYAAQVSFLQFAELGKSSLPEVLGQLENFDLCVFVNGELTSLSNAVSSSKNVIALRHNRLITDDQVPLIDYDRRLAVELLVEKMAADKIRSAGIIAYNDSNIKNFERINLFTALAAEKGISIAPEHFWKIDFDSPERLEQLTAKFKACKKLPEIFFADYSAHMDSIHQAGIRCGVRSSEDYQLVSICSGATLNAIPGNIWYIKIPRFDMGYGVVKSAVTARRNKEDHFELPLFAPELTILKRD